MSYEATKLQGNAFPVSHDPSGLLERYEVRVLEGEQFAELFRAAKALHPLRLIVEDKECTFTAATLKVGAPTLEASAETHTDKNGQAYVLGSLITLTGFLATGFVQRPVAIRVKSMKQEKLRLVS